MVNIYTMYRQLMRPRGSHLATDWPADPQRVTNYQTRPVYNQGEQQIIVDPCDAESEEDCS